MLFSSLRPPLIFVQICITISSQINLQITHGNSPSSPSKEHISSKKAHRSKKRNSPIKYTFLLLPLLIYQLYHLLTKKKKSGNSLKNNFSNDELILEDQTISSESSTKRSINKIKNFKQHSCIDKLAESRSYYNNNQVEQMPSLTLGTISTGTRISHHSSNIFIKPKKIKKIIPNINLPSIDYQYALSHEDSICKTPDTPSNNMIILTPPFSFENYDSIPKIAIFDNNKTIFTPEYHPDDVSRCSDEELSESTTSLSYHL